MRRSRRWAITAPYTDKKSYNGVAILSKRPLEDVTPRLKGNEADDQSRYIEALVAGDKGVLRIASIYAPNGNPLGTEKFPYKQAWLERLAAHASELLANEEPVALMGDYNVIPEDKDCYDPKAWMNDALFQPQSGRRCARSNIWVIPTPSAPAIAKRANTLSGIIRPGPGARTRASASTIFCSRPRRPTGLAPAP